MTTPERPYPTPASLVFHGDHGQLVLDQIRAVDRQRLVRRIGEASSATVQAVSAVLIEMFARATLTRPLGHSITLMPWIHTQGPETAKKSPPNLSGQLTGYEFSKQVSAFGARERIGRADRRESNFNATNVIRPVIVATPCWQGPARRVQLVSRIS